MPIGTGYKARAGFRLVGYAPGSFAYPVALGTPVPDTLGAFDLLPFTKEAISPATAWQADNTLDGYSAYREHNNVARLAGGSLDLNGRYLGLNQLLAAGMGYERVRTSTVLERPEFATRLNGAAPITGTVTASTGTTLTDAAANFPTTVVGEFVRLEKLGTNGDIYHQVRRITARPATTQITIAPDWVDNPVAATPYKIARTFAHQFEFSKNMHLELASEVLANPWNANARFVRWGTLAIDKQNGVWEWQGVYVESLAFKLDQDGLQITAELLPFWYDLRTSGRNASAATWGYHPETSYAVTKRIRFADCKFQLGPHGGDLDDSHRVGIASLEFSIKNNLQADLQTLASGLYREEPGRNAKRDVNGSFTVPRYMSNARINHYTAGDLLMAVLTCTGPTLDGLGADLATLLAFFRALRIEQADAPVDGAGLIAEKYNFRGLQPPSQSGTNLPQPSAGAENGELIISTWDHNPFNYFMGQDDSAY